MSTYYLFSQRHLYPSPSGVGWGRGAAQTEPSLFITLTARLKFIAVPCAPRRGARPYGVAFVCRSFLPNQPGHTPPYPYPPTHPTSLLLLGQTDSLPHVAAYSVCSSCAPTAFVVLPKVSKYRGDSVWHEARSPKYIDISMECKLCVPRYVYVRYQFNCYKKPKTAVSA